MDNAAPPFVEMWPALERRLHRALANMRVPPASRDDVVQETSLRIYRMWDRLDHSRPVWPLVRVVAQRCAIDEARRQGPPTSLDIPHESVADVEDEALVLIEVKRVCVAIGQLSSRDRQILLSEITSVAQPALSPGALKMGRLRARRRLKALLGESGPLLGVVPVRRLWQMAQARLASANTFARDDWFAVAAAGTALVLATGTTVVQPAPAVREHAAIRTTHRTEIERGGSEVAPIATDRGIDSPRVGATSAHVDVGPSPPQKSLSADEQERRPPAAYSDANVGGVGGASVKHDENGPTIRACAHADPLDPSSEASCAIVQAGGGGARGETTTSLR